MKLEKELEKELEKDKIEPKIMSNCKSNSKLDYSKSKYNGTQFFSVSYFGNIYVGFGEFYIILFN